MLTRIGRTQTLLTKIRYSAVSTMRMLSFLSGAARVTRTTARSFASISPASRPTSTSLSEHASYLSDNLQFLLDASLGLISIEQNAAMKLFSWAAVVFLPPTLIAGIFGMNFHYMPELNWHYGYPISLAVMLASAIGPYLYFNGGAGFSAQLCASGIAGAISSAIAAAPAARKRCIGEG